MRLSNSFPHDTIDWISLIVIILNVCAYCPILVYFLIIYRRYEKKEKHNNKQNVIHQRNSFLVYTINILAIFTNCSERIFMLSSEVWGFIHVQFFYTNLFLATTWWALMDLFAIKVYHLYYQQRLKQSIADRLWKKHIDPGIDDWYILNKNKYGNPLYLIKLVFIPYLLSVVIDTGLFAFLLGVGLFLNLSHLTLATIPITIAMFVFWKARKLDDMYNIRNEILYQFVILLTTLSVWMVIFLCCLYIVSDENISDRHHNNVHRFEWMTYLFITDAVTFALALFSTLYPIYLTNRNRHSVRLLHKTRDMEHSTVSHSSSSIHGVQGINYVIRDYDCLQSFMEQLVSEFCPENALFMVELIQIKCEFQRRNNNVIRIPKESILHGDDIEHKLQNQEDNVLYQVVDFNEHPEDSDDKDCIYTYIFLEDGAIRNRIVLTSKVPSSAILTAAPNNLYLQMRMLYDKYIKWESDYELNIPFHMRDSLQKCFEKEDIDGLEESVWFNVMDECCAEVASLLSFSLYRFIHTSDFERNSPNLPVDDDVTMKNILNSPDLPVIRNADSYNVIKEKYAHETQTQVTHHLF